MKNPFTGRESLSARVSSVDGSVHINRAARDAHDAMKRSQESMKRTQEIARRAQEAAKRGQEAARRGQQAMNQSRKDMELGHRNPGRLRPELSLQPGVSGRSSSGIGALVRVLIVLAVLAFILYALFIRFSHR